MKENKNIEKKKRKRKRKKKQIKQRTNEPGRQGPERRVFIF